MPLCMCIVDMSGQDAVNKYSPTPGQPQKEQQPATPELRVPDQVPDVAQSNDVLVQSDLTRTAVVRGKSPTPAASRRGSTMVSRRV